MYAIDLVVCLYSIYLYLSDLLNTLSFTKLKCRTCHDYMGLKLMVQLDLSMTHTRLLVLLIQYFSDSPNKLCHKSCMENESIILILNNSTMIDAYIRNIKY